MIFFRVDRRDTLVEVRITIDLPDVLSLFLEIPGLQVVYNTEVVGLVLKLKLILYFLWKDGIHDLGYDNLFFDDWDLQLAWKFLKETVSFIHIDFLLILKIVRDVFYNQKQGVVH